MNLNKKIINPKGEEVAKTFPSERELAALPRGRDGRPDIEKLERETVGNIILNCLSNYVVRDKKEGFYINTIAQSILSGDEKIEFKDKINSFLITVLDDMTHRKEKVKDEKGQEKEVEKGLYAAWAIIQCEEELGVKEP